MSALARLYLASGKQVSGCDLKASEITDELAKLGLQIFIGSNRIVGNPDLVIYSSAVPESELNDIKLPKMSQGEAIGQAMEGKYGIGVTGTNGKSTTAALLGLILDRAGVDPTVVIGTKLSVVNETGKFKANARLGSGEYVVAEADEYQRKMLATKPKMIVLTNVAEDHLDCYKDLQDIKNAFIEYIKSLPSDGIVVFNADDHNTVDVIHHCRCHKFSFGIHHYADLQALNLKTENGRQTFDVHYDDEKIAIFEMQVPGLFNISNALGAALAAIKLGVDIKVIQRVLADFAGTWRRFETVGKLGSAMVISDYGHHPAAVLGTLEAAKEFYPGEKVLLVFQPHHRNRTKKLFGEFVEALSHTQDVIVPEIFEVAGREHGEQISSKDLVVELVKLGVKAEYAEDLDKTEQIVKSKIKDFDIVMFMGAGDIDLLARKICIS